MVLAANEHKDLILVDSLYYFNGAIVVLSGTDLNGIFCMKDIILLTVDIWGLSKPNVCLNITGGLISILILGITFALVILVSA